VANIKIGLKPMVVIPVKKIMGLFAWKSVVSSITLEMRLEFIGLGFLLMFVLVFLAAVF